MSYRFVENDTGSTLRVTCKDDDSKAVIDLTGASVALRWKDAAGALQSRAMSIASPTTGGVVTYQFATGELYAPAMDFEVRITDAGGKFVTSLNLVNVKVRAALAA